MKVGYICKKKQVAMRYCVERSLNYYDIQIRRYKDMDPDAARDYEIRKSTCEELLMIFEQIENGMTEGVEA